MASGVCQKTAVFSEAISYSRKYNFVVHNYFKTDPYK